MKDKTHATCSKECCYALRKKLWSGEGNHQWGLKGKLNASWKSDLREQEGRYALVRCPNHPYRDDRDMVLRYILVAEEYLLTDDNSTYINGERHLKRECVVHHIDFDKTNDDPQNLHIFNNQHEHILFHNLYGHKINSIEYFYAYYQTMYVNKLENYSWLYTAYITFRLSANQISNMYDIPHTTLSRYIKKFKLNETKKRDEEKEMAMIKYILDNMSSSHIANAKEVSVDEIMAIGSERGTGSVGSSGK